MESRFRGGRIASRPVFRSPWWCGDRAVPAPDVVLFLFSYAKRSGLSDLVLPVQRMAATVGKHDGWPFPLDITSDQEIFRLHTQRNACTHALTA